MGKRSRPEKPEPLPARLRALGPLRWLLYAGAALFVLLVPAPGTRAVYDGWQVMPTLIVPALVPIVVMVVLLDALMSAVFMVERTGALRRRYQTSVAINLALVVAIVFAWWPYFRALVP